MSAYTAGEAFGFARQQRVVDSPDEWRDLDRAVWHWVMAHGGDEANRPSGGLGQRHAEGQGHSALRSAYCDSSGDGADDRQCDGAGAKPAGGRGAGDAGGTAAGAGWRASLPAAQSSRRSGRARALRARRDAARATAARSAMPTCARCSTAAGRTPRSASAPPCAVPLAAA